MSNIYYSDNGDEYRHDEIEEAICSVLDDMAEPAEGDEFSVWEGVCNFKKASWYAPDVLEHMSDSACDELPDFADGWPSTSAEQDQELKDAIAKVIDDWADKYKQQPNFGLMSNCKERQYRITKVAEYTSDFEYEEITERS